MKLQTNKLSLKTNSSRFSRTELLIVVVIIGIIVAFTIPNLLAARAAADDVSAIPDPPHGAQLIRAGAGFVRR
jgi:competence protein ComGC